MKNFITGLIIGLILGGGIAFAYTKSVSLQDGTGHELGTTSNPINISGV